MTRRLHILVGTVAAFLYMGAQAAVQLLKTIDVPGALQTELWDVNDAGTIVGWSNLGTFVIQGGALTMLPDDHGSFFSATSISNSGAVFGSTYAQDGTFVHAARYENGSYTPFSVPGIADPGVRRVSPNGRYVTGTYTVNDGTAGFAYDMTTGAVHTFAPNEFGLTIMQGVNDRGQVVGSTNGPNGVGLVHDMGTDTTLTFAYAGALSRLRFRDIDDAGRVVGLGLDADFRQVGLFGSPGGDLETFAPPGADFPLLYGMNNEGLLVGSYTDSDGVREHGFIATVPEPSAVALWACGLGALAAMRRYRSKS